MRYIQFAGELACLAMFFLVLIAGLCCVVTPVGIA